MNNEYVQATVESGVLKVMIDRQSKLNALNGAVLQELLSVFESMASRDDVHCVVIRGAGDKAFVAGADITEFLDLDKDGLSDLTRLGNGLMSTIESLDKPVIGVVNGYALGGGCELALACHIRIASSNAQLGLPEIHLGLIPGYGGTQRLSRLVGQGRALEMMLTGKPVSAEKALQMGLVNQVVELDDLDETADMLASKLARSAPIAMKGILQAVIQGGDTSQAQGLELEHGLFKGLFETEDMREGTAAFLEKRKPRFKGS
jgi:enoyl-CoA hydratase